MSAIPEIPKMKPPVQTPEQIKSKYENIELSFGKYNGKSLKEVAEEDAKYLEWLKNKLKENKNLSPTQLAIIKYINAL